MTLSEFSATVKATVDSRLGGRDRRDVPLSVSEQIAQAVKRLIIKGELRPGERILETDLATMFHVSRAPVRDALRILHKEGFVDLIPRRGAQVYLPTAADISDLYEVRAELFALAARKAAAAMDVQLAHIMQNGLALMAAMAGDEATLPLDFLKVRSGLALLIMTAANNPKLTAEINVLAMQAVMHVRVYDSPEHRRLKHYGWQCLCDAITRHDGEGAATEARCLLQGSRDELLRRMTEKSALPEQKMVRARSAELALEGRSE